MNRIWIGVGAVILVGAIVLLAWPSCEERGSYGLTLLSSGANKAVTVASVDAGGPAELAAVTPGATVLSIDGVPVNELGSMAYNLVSGPSVGIGDVVVLTIGEKGETREISLTAIDASGEDR